MSVYEVLVTEIEYSKKIENFKYKKQLKEAISIQNKLQFFTLPFTEDFRDVPYYDLYLRKMKRKINNQKAYNRFKESISFPLTTNEFINTIFNSLSKVFDGDGKFIELNPEVDKKTIGFEYIKEDVWKRFVTAPNSFIVTNKNEECTYRYFVDITNVEYIEFKDDTITEFSYNYNEGDKKYICYFDTDSIVIFEDVEDGVKLIEEFKHDLGICPVDFISNTKLSHLKPLIRTNPIITSLGDIEELLTVAVMENQMNRYIMPYLVEAKKTGADAGCKYRVGDTYCDNGYLYRKQENDLPLSVLDENGIPAKCPQCNKEIGFGSVIEIPARNLSGDDFAKVVANVLDYKTLSKEVLQYPTEKRLEIETKIYNRIVNKQESLNNAQQHNEVRVRSTMEDKTSVLLNLKKVFECVCSNLITKDLKFQTNGTYESTYVSLGSKFFLLSETEYLDKIAKGKETNMIDYTDDERGLIEVKYIDNKIERNKNIFILALEKAAKPYRNLTPAQMLDLVKSNSEDEKTKQDFYLYNNFHKIIREIELDKGKDIMDLFPTKKINEQIKLITKIIQEYGQVENS